MDPGNYLCRLYVLLSSNSDKKHLNMHVYLTAQATHAAVPEVGFLADTNSAGAADQRQTLASGFSALSHATRAATQSPIPLPPIAQGVALPGTRDDSDAMCMSPPHGATGS
jgi:hypothetical protein